MAASPASRVPHAHRQRSHQPAFLLSALPSSYQLPLSTAIPNSHLLLLHSTPLQALSLLLWRASANPPRFPNPSSSLARVACQAATPGSSPYSAPIVRPLSRTPAAAGWGLTPRTCSRSSPSSSDSHVRFLRRTFPRVVVSLVFPAHAFVLFCEAEFGLLLVCLLTDSPACFFSYLRIRMSREFLALLSC